MDIIMRIGWESFYGKDVSSKFVDEITKLVNVKRVDDFWIKKPKESEISIQIVKSEAVLTEAEHQVILGRMEAQKDLGDL